MKSIKIITYLFLALNIFASCDKETIRVSGEVIRTQVNITDYSGLRVSDAFNVFISFSENDESIIIEVNEDILDRIEVKKEGEDLIVRIENRTNIRGNATLNVYITTKEVNFFDISGASNVTLDNELSAEKVILELSGASGYTGELDVANLELNASGASEIDLFGSAGECKAQLSGASKLTDYDLIVQTLDIELSGASNAFLSVTDNIDIHASGASTLSYKGNAVVGIKELSDASDLIKKD